MAVLGTLPDGTDFATMTQPDIVAIVRMVFIYLHLLALLASAAGIAFADFAMFARRHVDTRLLRKSTRAVAWALVALWISGLEIIWLDTGFDPALLATMGKLQAKLVVVTLLTLNGFLLHRHAFPQLLKPRLSAPKVAQVFGVLGAFSGVSWLFALFLGVGKAVAPILGLGGFLALYAVALAVGTGVSFLLFVPRVEGRVGLVSSKSGKSRSRDPERDEQRVADLWRMVQAEGRPPVSSNAPLKPAKARKVEPPVTVVPREPLLID